MSKTRGLDKKNIQLMMQYTTIKTGNYETYAITWKILILCYIKKQDLKCIYITNTTVKKFKIQERNIQNINNGCVQVKR